MEEKVWFDSDGLKLCGVLNTPEGLKPEERRPAIINLHGFGTSKDAQSMRWPGRALTDWGYVTLRFDFRGLNESEGERGRVICLEQVEDTKAALLFLAGRPEATFYHTRCWARVVTAAFSPLEDVSTLLEIDGQTHALPLFRWRRLRGLLTTTHTSFPFLYGGPIPATPRAWQIVLAELPACSSSLVINANPFATEGAGADADSV